MRTTSWICAQAAGLAQGDAVLTHDACGQRGYFSQQRLQRRDGLPPPLQTQDNNKKLITATDSARAGGGDFAH